MTLNGTTGAGGSSDLSFSAECNGHGSRKAGDAGLYSGCRVLNHGARVVIGDVDGAEGVDGNIVGVAQRGDQNG